jgi:hypothetical protein
MILPAFKTQWDNSRTIKPRMQILEVRDRDAPDAEPLALLLIEREEVIKFDHDGLLESATVTFSYEPIKTHCRDTAMYRNQFKGSFTRRTNTVSLTSGSNSKGLVALDLNGLKGQRVGTYFFNEIVTWVKQWPDAEVNAIELLIGQAGEQNKERRNHFYERFNIQFDYKDADRREGTSVPMKAADLGHVETWKSNIRELDVMKFMSDLSYKADSATAELEYKHKAVKDLINQLRAIESKPLRWAIGQWLGKLYALALPMLIVATVVFGCWRSFSK